MLTHPKSTYGARQTHIVLCPKFLVYHIFIASISGLSVCSIVTLAVISVNINPECYY